MSSPPSPSFQPTTSPVPEPEEPSPCNCIAENLLKNQENHCEKWLDIELFFCLLAVGDDGTDWSAWPAPLLFATVKSHLEKECYIHQETCPKKSLVPDYTNLHNAVREENEEMVKKLLTSETPVDPKSKYNLTPLHIAVYRGNLNITSLLLYHGASVDSECILEDHTWVPLQFAILGRHSKIVKLLLQYEINDSTKNYKWNPFRPYDINENINAINTYLFVSHLDRGNKRRNTCLLDSVDASMQEYQTIIRHLLNVCSVLPDITKILRVLIHCAIEKGFFKIVEDLLIWGADIDIIFFRAYRSQRKGFLPLHTAAKHNKHEILKLLLKHGADVNVRDVNYHTPLQIAAKYGNFKAVEALLTHCVDDEDIGNIDDVVEYKAHALIMAAEKGHQRIVEVLIEHQADVNFKRDDNETALLRAAKGGHEHVVEVLLKNEADVEAINCEGLTVLDVAITRLSRSDAAAYRKIIRLLLDNGADINAIKWCVCLCARTPNIVKEVIVKMKAAGMHVDVKKFQCIVKSKQLNDFRKDCEAEVEKLRKTKCGESIVSFFDILTKNPHRLANIYRNEDIVETLESEVYKGWFPIYCSMIENKFFMGRKRQILMDRALYSFHSLIGNEIVDVLSEDVLKFLSNKDLKNLDEASMT